MSYKRCFSTFFCSIHFVRSLINRKDKIIMILTPTISNPYLSNPVRKKVGNPLYLNLSIFSTRFGIRSDFSK